jgi:diguanylate cyclase
MDSPNVHGKAAMIHFSPLRHLGRRQALFLRRLNMALSVYIVCFVIAWFSNRAGMLSIEPILYAIPVAIAFNLALYAAVISGFNLRFRDPSLALFQLIGATGFIMFGAYHADEARPIFLLLYTVPFLFSAIRLPLVQHLMGAVFAMACHALVIYLAMQTRPDTVQFVHECLQWATQAIVLLWIVAIGHSHRTIRLRASTDQLTGVLNRHQIIANLHRERQRFGRGGPAFSICFVDVDHLKSINDRFGHGVGDQVLRRVANEIGSQLRGMDDFGRFGGDEFVIALPDTKLESALKICARVQERVSALSFAQLGLPAQVTVSMGVAESRSDESVEALLERADQALYRAKRAGRDRVAANPDAYPIEAKDAAAHVALAV